MATNIQKKNAIKRQNFFYKVRPGYYNQAKHLSDEYKNLGYDYRGKILKKMTSPELWSNPIQYPFFSRIEAMINFLIEQVKYIKKTFSIAHSKDSINLN
ncbi:MAG TPA: hypothetical protein PK122_00325 [Candidatus Paceibacterota bacterium]|nr:hypothetical protein [Candidatus Paceibacterota bacterium]